MEIMFGSTIALLLFAESNESMVAIAGTVCAIFGPAVVAVTRKKNKEMSLVKQL
jgi:hypothetical protein